MREKEIMSHIGGAVLAWSFSLNGKGKIIFRRCIEKMKYLNRLMKLPLEYYIVGFLFLVVIFLSIYGTSAISNFGEAKSLNMYPYENFESSFSQPVHSAANSSGCEKPAVDGTKGVLGIFEADGLKASPIDAPPLFDPVSKLKGSAECTGNGKTNGYSNSLGGLCFTEDVNKLFHARGTNTSLKDSA